MQLERNLLCLRCGHAYSPYVFNTPVEQLPAFVVTNVTVPAALCTNTSGHNVYKTSCEFNVLDDHTDHADRFIMTPLCFGEVL